MVISRIIILLILWFSGQNLFADIGTNEREKMLVVDFPLKGVWITPNSPGSKVPSHGTSFFGESYAIDFVMITDNDNYKKPYKKSFFEYLFHGLQLSDFYGWGQTVYSPIGGEVIEVKNDIKKRNPVNIFNDYNNTLKVTNEFTAKNGSS